MELRYAACCARALRLTETAVSTPSVEPIYKCVLSVHTPAADSLCISCPRSSWKRGNVRFTSCRGDLTELTLSCTCVVEDTSSPFPPPSLVFMLRGAPPGSEGLGGRRLVQRKSAEVQGHPTGLRLRKGAGKVALSAPQHVPVDVSVEDINTQPYCELNKTE